METAGDNPEEGGDDVKSSCPLRPGQHTCYNGVTKGSEPARVSEPQKLNSDFFPVSGYRCVVYASDFLLRKEVIQPHLPIRLPCYDFTPVIRPAFGSSFLSVRSLTSGIPNSHGVTGGVYKTRERIHRSMLICDY